MKYLYFLLISVVMLMSFEQCVTPATSGQDDRLLRLAVDVPEAFFPPSGILLDDRSCKSPMIDPRDGTEIIMVSSTTGFGDYRVPEGRYGVLKGELLRINCSNGEAIGIVKD